MLTHSKLRFSLTSAAKKDHDYGVPWYHQQTRSDRFSPPYCDRLSMARYMSAMSAKLSFLAGLCRQICTVEKKMPLVFADWPMTLWNAGAFLMNLSFSEKGGQMRNWESFIEPLIKVVYSAVTSETFLRRGREYTLIVQE